MKTNKSSRMWCLVAWLAWCSPSLSQEPGIHCEIQDVAGNVITRTDDGIALVRQSGRLIDRRLASGDVTVRWNGMLLVQGAGKYHFYAQLIGACEVTVGEQVAIESDCIKSEWVESKSFELQPGLVPIRVSYRSPSTGAPASIDKTLFRLFWSGPGFEIIEPIGGKYLFHQSSEQRAESSVVDSDVGGSLAQSYRCNACHVFDGRASLAAPALDKLSAASFRPAWLVEWLSGSDTKSRESDDRHCPTFGLNDEQANAVARYLLRSDESSDDDVAAMNNARVKGDLVRGKHLFLSVGCLACHQVTSDGDTLGHASLFDGGDLTRIGAKRPPGFIDDWLADPAQFNLDHRMPVFELSIDERTDLSAYLASLGSPTNEIEVGQDSDDAQGRRLVEQSNCVACHRLSKQGEPQRSENKTAIQITDWQSPCSAPGSRAVGQPLFVLGAADNDKIRAYVERTQQTSVSWVSALPPRVASELIAENNCLSCHSRGFSTDAGGLAATTTELVESHTEFTGTYAALVPPPLHQIGDKLSDEGLRTAISGSATSVRPWLQIRMPRFRLSDSDVQLLVEYFVAQDRMPSAANEETNGRLRDSPSKSELVDGATLVAQDGFNCVSCHSVGDYQPENPPLNARGPSLSAVAGRVRPEWFARWVRNPLRIVPNVEMPSIMTPVPGVLGAHLDAQIAAVWHAVRDPQLVIAKLQPFRVLRQTGHRLNDRAIVLTDVLRMRHYTGTTTRQVKPFAIGLPNRHNVLFDMDKCQLNGWWLGDLAGQMNEGKVWYWLANGRNLLAVGMDSNRREEIPDFVLVRSDGTDIMPTLNGQFLTRPDAWRHTDAGVEFEHRLHFAFNGVVSRPARIRQTFRALDPESGFLRRLQFENLMSTTSIRIRVLPFDSDSLTVAPDRRSVSSTRSEPKLTVRIVDGPFQFANDGTIIVATANCSSDAKAVATSLSLAYATDLEAGRINVQADPPSRFPPTTMHIVPGMDAVRLPIAESLMPTGITWDSAGTMFVSSLDGRVWTIVDSDGDDLPDLATVFSDGLATPYGLIANQSVSENGYVDVVDKTALLRLRDRDGDGRADETKTVATGWGHTDDYHDWVIGLEQDSDSASADNAGYFIAIPCQQDDRTEAAAHLRGKVLQLKPREPSPDAPEQYSLHEITGGHRFPHGIARNRDDALFVTDNQGNFNPFNELNHVIPGRRYGFINRLERKPGFSPELTPPAINIPHPWTRSVNGICFLESPATTSSRETGFGPFEGHLIGCEYDTQRLVRMSLERFDGEYQGAVYPFTYDSPASGPALQGPVVCEVGPDRHLYVGSLRESGWGGGKNTGEIVRLNLNSTRIPAGIAEIRAMANGFVIEFTQAVDQSLATDASNYGVMSYRRVSTLQYGGDDMDRRDEPVAAMTMSMPNQVHIRLVNGLRTGFVYEFRLQPLVAVEFFPAEGHYTLNRLPH